MHDRITLNLFNSFPREIGNPVRSVANSVSDFINFINRTSGVADCFTGVYDLNTTLDKIFFDFDGVKALEDAKKVYKGLVDKDLPVIPVVTGRRGIHLYILFKLKRYENPKQTLSTATYSILKGIIDVEKSTIDTHVIGDIRRLCRIPNTQRSDKVRWCTYLPVPEWLYFDEADLHEWSLQPHYNLEYDMLRKHTLTEFNSVVVPEVSESVNGDIEIKTVIRKDLDQSTLVILKNLLRPILFNAIVDQNPKHHIRVAATIDLLSSGLSIEKVFELYSHLSWGDWDSKITLYQIQNISNKNLKPYTNVRLKQVLGVSA